MNEVRPRGASHRRDVSHDDPNGRNPILALTTLSRVQRGWLAILVALVLPARLDSPIEYAYIYTHHTFHMYKVST